MKRPPRGFEGVEDAEIAAFDLRYFPHDQHDRFVNSVTSGKNAMPPWGQLLQLAAQLQQLDAGVILGDHHAKLWPARGAHHHFQSDIAIDAFFGS